MPIAIWGIWGAIYMDNFITLTSDNVFFTTQHPFWYIFMKAGYGPGK
jgi:hypothetical protein